jgi:hypothetical protein
VKTQLSSKFDMKDLGDENFILGMEIKRDREKGYQKGILHLISIQIFIFLLPIMILELLGR